MLCLGLFQIVIILRGPPGSGKTHVARLIKVNGFLMSNLCVGGRQQWGILRCSYVAKEGAGQDGGCARNCLNPYS